VLAAAQIRDLMGSVPNAVFERLLEAVAQGESAELMNLLNVLLNAGHNPSSLARQMVRYLRNTLMAKLGGEQTELLQISGDERARATRTALLFTEEELTRNLQILLRTFDDLNYRQEQRFHLELGLLKLIHAQRLLPLEELLSGVVSGSGARSASAPSSRPPASAPKAHAAPARALPSVSPFSTSPPRNARQSAASEPVAETIIEVAAARREVTPFPVASGRATGFAETVTEGSLAKAPEKASPPKPPAPPDPPGLQTAPDSPDSDALRQAVCVALATAGHQSASQLLGTATWTLDGASMRIEVPGLGKKMLSLTVNAAAEKIIRQELQRQGASTRFMVVPGEGAAVASPSAMSTPSGSVLEAALANPLVQKAKEILNAEIRSVVDLRVK
jgi:DNA polymerase-3 subunit gamma/tau